MPRFSEIALLHNALSLLLPFATDDDAGESGGFHGPSLEEFFPPALFFDGTVFEINRLMLIRFLVVLALLLVFVVGTRRLRVVPNRRQSIIELAVGFVQSNVVDQTLGVKDGKRFGPLLITMFFFVVFMNITGIIPGLNLAGTAGFGMPVVLAVVSYVVFIYAGLKKHPGTFLKSSLFPSGVPVFLYLIVTPIEFLSTFILRPVTLSIRLFMNMVAGHMLLVLCFSATSFFLFTAGGWFGLFSIGTFAFGLAFTIFEILVAVLQAYVFAYLAAVYIQLALAEEH